MSLSPRLVGIYGGMMPHLGTAFGGEREVWLMLREPLGELLCHDKAQGRYR